MADTLGERIRFKRKSLRMSQKTLAKNSNVSRITISQLESGARVSANFNTMLAIAHALGVSVGYFDTQEVSGWDSTTVRGRE